MYAILTANAYVNHNVQENNADQINAVEVVEPVNQDIHVMVVDNAFVHQQHVQL